MPSQSLYDQPAGPMRILWGIYKISDLRSQIYYLGGWYNSGIFTITDSGTGFTFNCSTKNAMRSRRASAFNAWGASYSLKRFGSLTTAAYKGTHFGSKNLSTLTYCKNTVAGAACAT